MQAVYIQLDRVTCVIGNVGERVQVCVCVVIAVPCMSQGISARLCMLPLRYCSCIEDNTERSLTQV